MFDVTNEIQDIVDPLKSARRIATDSRIHYLKPWTRWGLCNCGDVKPLLELILDMDQIFRIDAPERLEVVIDLIVFIGELDVMFHTVVPPFRPVSWVKKSGVMESKAVELTTYQNQVGESACNAACIPQ